MLAFEEKYSDRWLGIISFFTGARRPDYLFIFIGVRRSLLFIYFIGLLRRLSAMACLFIIFGLMPAGVLSMFVFVSGMWTLSREACHMPVFLLRHSIHLSTSCSARSLSHFPLSKSIFVQ